MDIVEDDLTNVGDDQDDMDVEMFLSATTPRGGAPPLLSARGGPDAVQGMVNGIKTGGSNTRLVRRVLSDSSESSAVSFANSMAAESNAGTSESSNFFAQSVSSRRSIRMPVKRLR